MRLNNVAAAAAAAARKVNFQWWGGIGCRVAFLVTSTLVIAALLVSAFLYRDAKRAEEQEMRSRALWFGQYVSLLAADHLASNNRSALNRIVQSSLRLEASFERTVDHELRSLGLFDRTGGLLVGPEQFQQSGRPGYTESMELALDQADLGLLAPKFSSPGGGRLVLTLPVLRGTEPVGFLKASFEKRLYEERFTNILHKAGIIIGVVVVLGLLSSQLIALGIIGPITRLGEAVDALRKQNWKTPLPVKGKDELARLAIAFNEMAEALKQREASLSQGNRDLFILHTAGLDLMECLDLSVLLEKIVGRAKDLTKADTVMVTAVDRRTRQLRYLAADGSNTSAYLDRDLPLEAGGIYNWLASYGTPLLIQDAQADFRLDSALARGLGLKNLIAAPLWSSNTLLAVLTVVNKKGTDPFDRRDLRLLTVFANLAASALQNAHLYDDLKRTIREVEQTRLQLVHSTKLAAIGELATNLAHEINNPLTSVLGYTSHLIKTLDLAEESRHKLKLMEQETLRVRKIIRNLLDFSRQKPSRMQHGDLAVPLRESIALLQGVAERGHVSIETELPAAPLVVDMDHNELKQVFINIMNNAFHAMPSGGRLRIKLDSTEDGMARLSFEDSGHGIAEEHAEKIFEPFFTTKAHGDGTGLGLSISNRIIQSHQGRIEASSRAGQGAVFSILLPLAVTAGVAGAGKE